jgi:hypothetical protein
MGQPFRAVVKTFQVRVWNDLRAAWTSTPADAQAQVSRLAGVDVAGAMQR